MNFTSWYDDVLIDVKGCEPELAVKHIRQAAIAFCDQSNVLVKDLTAFDTVALTATYALVMPTDTDIAQVIEVFANGVKLEAKSRDDLIERYGDLSQAFGNEKYYYQEANNSITLCPIPTAVVTLRVKVSLKPNRTAATLEDWIANKYYDAIAHGAKARLFEIPEKPWSNAQLSSYHASQFNSSVSAARRSASSGMARSPSRTKLW
jgi:hypothetical protein